jgi:hypothetical protein
VILGLLCAAWVLVAANVAYCHFRNTQKRDGKFDQYAGLGDDRDPSYKYIL